MIRLHKTLAQWAGLICLTCLPAWAQDVQFLPEMDTYLKLTSTLRTYLEVKDDRDGGDPAQIGIGPSLQFYLNPLVKLKDMTAFDLDDSKSRMFVLEAGYRSVAAPNTQTTQRMLTSATLNFPLRAGFHISDRNRFDLDWKRSFTWRYRNKIAIERTISIRSYHLIPYGAVEPYYESKYHKWSTTALYAGCLLPIGPHVEFNAYYEHENNTGEPLARPDNAVGLALYILFSIHPE